MLKRIKTGRSLPLSVVIMIGAILPYGCSFGADWSFNPSVTLSEKYDSNITFSATSAPGVPREDYITTLEPVFSLVGETQQTKFELDTDTKGLTYVENPQFDTIDTNTYTSLTECWSPRFTTGANFRFMHDYTLENELETSGIVTQKTERYQYNGGGDVKYALTDTLNLQASGNYIDTNYPTHPPNLPDYDAYQVTLTPVWSISPRTDVGLNSNFYRQSYPSFSADINTVTEMVYWRRLFTPTTSLDVSAGYYFTWTSFLSQVIRYIPPAPPLLVNVPGSGSDSAPAAQANLKTAWSERFSTTLMASKSQYDDVYARSFDKISVGFTAAYRLSELTTFNILVSYDMNDQISQGSQPLLNQAKVNIDYVNIAPSIETRLGENLTARLRGSYQLENQSYSRSPGVDLNRFIVWLELTCKWPRLWATN